MAVGVYCRSWEWSLFGDTVRGCPVHSVRSVPFGVGLVLGVVGFNVGLVSCCCLVLVVVRSVRIDCLLAIQADCSLAVGFILVLVGADNGVSCVFVCVICCCVLDMFV